jgi:translation initiation factor 3 subunit B
MSTEESLPLAPAKNDGLSEEEQKMIAESEELDGYISDTPLDVDDVRYPELNTNFDNCIVLMQLPKVPSSKLEKLTKVIHKLVSKLGTLDAIDASGSGFNGVHVPYNEAQDTTLGIAFVAYASVTDAKKAATTLQDYQFDKNHNLRVVPYPRAAALSQMAVPDENQPPPEFNAAPAPYEEKPNATFWLHDSHQRDQFVIRYQRETVVQWYDHKADPVVDYDGSREKAGGVVWCDNYVHWSPHGSYLATLVPDKGVILWSGPNYQKVARFPCPGVNHVSFSPQENYLLVSNTKSTHDAIKIFHIASGKKLREFPLYPAGVSRTIPNPAAASAPHGSVPPTLVVPPPPFLWSYNDEYIARKGQDLIAIYELPSLKLLQQRSLMTDGITEFQWSPTANVLAYWVREPFCPLVAFCFELDSLSHTLILCAIILYRLQRGIMYRRMWT